LCSSRHFLTAASVFSMNTVRKPITLQTRRARDSLSLSQKLTTDTRPKGRSFAHSRTCHFDQWTYGRNGTDGAGHGGGNGAWLHQSLLDGIERAKSKGDVYKGRKPMIDRSAVRDLFSQGIGASEIARRLKIGRASVVLEL
jgi:Helix-turn-helix domain of resolvase